MTTKNLTSLCYGWSTRIQLCIAILMTVSLSGCQQDPIPTNNAGLPDKIKQGIKPEVNERIYAWEAPYSLTANDLPSNVVSKLQDAIDDAAAQNKELIIEKGVYTIDSTITFPSGVDVDFGDAEFVRESGTATGDIFTMFTNADHVNGNSDITIKNLKINGNRKVDNLSAIYYYHRFSGLELNKVSNSKLYRITVTQTVNAELNGVPASGIYFENGCNNINCYELTAYDIDRTAIYINASSNIRIYGALTYNNWGTGIAADFSTHCEFNNIIAYKNGFYPGHIWGDPNPTQGVNSYRYSNVSINARYSKINGVVTSKCTGSGLVIGHPGSPTISADYTIVDNVESFDNELDGITVSNSKHVLMSNLHVYNNYRYNVQVYDTSSHVQIQNASIHGYGYDSTNNVPHGEDGINIVGGAAHNLSNVNVYDNFKQGIRITGATGSNIGNLNIYGNRQQGVFIDGGGGYNLNHINVYENRGQGIYIRQTTGPVSIGSEVSAFNNGMNNHFNPGSPDPWTAGIHAQNAKYIYINNSKAFSNQPSGSVTQKYGIIIQNVDIGRITYPQCYGNGTQNAVLELPTNTNVVILQ